MTVILTSNLHQGGGSQGNVRESDPISNSLPTIDHAHHENHEGNMFVSSAIWTLVADTNTKQMLFKTSSLGVHMIFEVAASGAATLLLHEDPTFTDPPTDYGTAADQRRLNRTKAVTLGDTSILTYYDPTILAPGTFLDRAFISGSPSGPFRLGGSGSSREEWILGANKLYLLSLTNNAGGTATMVAKGIWYTETLNT